MTREHRPVPPRGTPRLPGTRDPDAYFYVGHGRECVLLCEHGTAARWRNAVMFTSDEARQLAITLLMQADLADQPRDEGDEP